MPEHVHVVLLPRRADYRIEYILASLKRRIAKLAKEHLLQTGNRAWLDRLTARRGDRTVFRLWQTGGGFDRNIWGERSLAEIIAYVHGNRFVEASSRPRRTGTGQARVIGMGSARARF